MNLCNHKNTYFCNLKILKIEKGLKDIFFYYQITITVNSENIVHIHPEYF